MDRRVQGDHTDHRDSDNMVRALEGKPPLAEQGKKEEEEPPEGHMWATSIKAARRMQKEIKKKMNEST